MQTKVCVFLGNSLGPQKCVRSNYSNYVWKVKHFYSDRKKGGKGLRVEVEMRGLGENWKRKEVSGSFGVRDCGCIVRDLRMTMDVPTRGGHSCRCDL